MKLAADTGALLSLACSLYFEKIKANNKILVAKTVMEELKQFAVYEDFLGKKAKEILKKGWIIKNPVEKLEINLEKADEEVFSLALEQKCLALTDDIHAARVAKERLNLTTRPSFYLLLLLYKKKIISKEALIADINKIMKERNWTKGIWEKYALELIEGLRKKNNQQNFSKSVISI